MKKYLMFAAVILSTSVALRAQASSTVDSVKGEVRMNLQYQNRVAKDSSKPAKAVVLDMLDMVEYNWEGFDVIAATNTQGVAKHMTGAFYHLNINTPRNGAVDFFLPRLSTDTFNDPNWLRMVKLYGTLTRIFNEGANDPSDQWKQDFVN